MRNARAHFMRLSNSAPKARASSMQLSRQSLVIAMPLHVLGVPVITDNGCAWAMYETKMFLPEHVH